MTINSTGQPSVYLGANNSPKQSSEKPKIGKWIALGIFGVFGIIMVLMIILFAAKPNAEDFVEETYARHTAYDMRGQEGHIATGNVRQIVKEITRGVGKPLDVRTASDGATFMKYKKHMVALFPEGNRTRVYADDYRAMWYAFSSYTGQWWISTPPSSSSSHSGYRGGGSGFGK